MRMLGSCVIVGRNYKSWTGAANVQQEQVSIYKTIGKNPKYNIVLQSLKSFRVLK